MSIADFNGPREAARARMPQRLASTIAHAALNRASEASR